MATGSAGGGPSSTARGNRTLVQVQFDRHIVGVLGDEHYPEADFLFTELAANAYDADATEVRFDYRFGEDAGREGGYRLTVEDNGSGMDFEDLRSYFTFGLPQKLQQKQSPRLHRRLIGRYGLGKVSALKAAPKWYLETESDSGRHFVDVDFEKWMAGEVDGFTLERRRAQGKIGTRIELVGVHVKHFREDRVVRAIRKLPLGRDFKVYLDGRLIPPRVWDGIRHFPIKETVEFASGGKQRSERIDGGIWIYEDELPVDEGRAGDRPSGSVKEVLEQGRDRLAGVEVKVNGATIVREFFGRKQHGHGVNWIWGYVNADWLPVVANRTDFVRDSAEGEAFYKRMATVFGDIYTPWRDEEELRKRLKAARAGRKKRKALAEVTEAKLKRAEKTLVEVASRVQELFDEEPERMPFFGTAPEPRRGRPSETRIRPLFEFKAIEVPGRTKKNGNGAAPEYELERERSEASTVVEAHERRGKHKELVRADSTVAAGLEGPARKVIQAIGNVPLHIEYSLDADTDLAYRWDNQKKGGPLLHINANHPLHRIAMRRINSDAHKLYVAMIVAIALAEQRWNVIDRQGIDDYILELVRGGLSQA
jgi:histidine kinase/DNA gyrase B/HSP90-like ATPase